jgi:hypothetical protein
VLPAGVSDGSDVLVTYGPRETGINRVLRVEPAREGEVATEAGRIGLPPRRAPAGSAGSAAPPGPGSPAESGVAQPQLVEPAPMERRAPRRYIVPLVSVLVVAGAVTLWSLTRRRP